MSKQELKLEAQKLRREGKTYSEIMKVIPVAKSTISLWLQEVALGKKQKQIISDKRKEGQKRGATAQRDKRIKKQNFLIDKARVEIGKISERELWLIGIALYWAEGTKEREHNIGGRVQFSNSDPLMIKVFLKWLQICIKLPRERISCQIYIHDSHKENIKDVISFWSSVTGFPVDHFKQIYFKRNKINTKRHNVGDLYNGLLRVNITSSSDLNRSISGWTKGITENCGIV